MKSRSTTYVLFPGTRQPPEKPLPALPTPRYCPPLNIEEFTACSSSCADPLALSTGPSESAGSPAPSIFDLSEDEWHPDPGPSSVSRPDSSTIPTSPSCSGWPRDGCVVSEMREGFHAIIRAGERVKYWIAVDDALKGVRPEGMPFEEWMRLREMAGEITVRNERGGNVQYLQLMTGTYMHQDESGLDDGSASSVWSC